MSKPQDNFTQADIESAILNAGEKYFNDCRQRVQPFVKRHFCYPGAWRLNRIAFGMDILRAPVNLVWAPIYALLSLIRHLLEKRGYRRIASWLEHVPEGLTTDVQTRVADLIRSELLESSGATVIPDSYLKESLEALYAEHQDSDFDASAHTERQLDALVEDALLQYRVARTASSDIANTVSCTIFGAFAFQKFTPGGFGIGFFIAAVLAEHFAVNNFFLGETLGGIYYGFFPAEPGTGLTLLSVLFVLVILASFASLSGLITDPIQAMTGLHRRRLKRMLDNMESDFRQRTNGSFRPKDQFVARILEVFDMVKSNLG